jgi:hypothetical protein
MTLFVEQDEFARHPRMAHIALSEIKAVARALKAEVVACRGILNTMGWIQGPTRIEEDNAALLSASHVVHMTHNLRHLEHTDSWINGKVADGTATLIPRIIIVTLVQIEFHSRFSMH